MFNECFNTIKFNNINRLRRGHNATVPTSCILHKCVIAAGGGGIPVVKEQGRYQGVDAVIDKDKTSALLAAHLPLITTLFLNNWDAAATSCNHKRTMFNECFNTIKSLIKHGTLVIAAGGGGIPVVKEQGRYQGVDAVIDTTRRYPRPASSINVYPFSCLILSACSSV
jgi:carbamate kinase